MITSNAKFMLYIDKEIDFFLAKVYCAWPGDDKYIRLISDVYEVWFEPAFIDKNDTFMKQKRPYR
jgi:hypothetical protein